MSLSSSDTRFSAPCPRPVPSSLRETMARVKEQIDPACFTAEEWPFARELMMIVVEIYMLPPDCRVKIDGGELPASMVQEIYTTLAAEHVRSVMERFSSLTRTVKHKKTYLRTLLYNEVFELEGRTVNDVNVWMNGKS